jgi:hypothetical protein
VLVRRCRRPPLWHTPHPVGLSFPGVKNDHCTAPLLLLSITHNIR